MLLLFYSSKPTTKLVLKISQVLIHLSNPLFVESSSEVFVYKFSESQTQQNNQMHIIIPRCIVV